MRKYYTFLSASMLSVTLLSGCMQNPSKEQAMPTATAAPSPASTATLTKANTAKPRASVNNTAQNNATKNTKVTKAKPAIARVTAKPISKPISTGVKTIKPEPALKAGKKLSAQEVEDLIRKLSVCRPS